MSSSLPSPPLPPLIPSPPPLDQKPVNTVTDNNGLLNPGEFEELGKRVKEQIFPTLFEGCKVAVQKGLSKNFQTSHTLTLGSSTQPSQWQLGATYVGTKRIADNDFRPVLVGDISSSGNFAAVLLHQFGKSWKVKLNAQTQGPQWVAYQGSVDYVGKDFTASLTVANPDISSMSVVAVCQYLQSITPRLALGTEMLYQRGQGMEVALLSLGGRYKTDTWEASARAGLHAWNLTYTHQASPELTFVAECEGSLMQAESTAAFGYKLSLGETFSLRGRINSRWTIGALVEKRLDPLPAQLLLSGQLSHRTDESRFGIGVSVG